MRSARLFPAIALLAASAAVAQDITLYENDNYNGRRFTASQAVQNLQYSGFNDMASSATIRGGRWQVCSDAYFRGRCVTLNPGNYPSLASMGLNDRVSSVREIGWEGGGSGGGSGIGSITFYDQYGLTGAPYTLNATLPNFDATGFNDRAASAVIREGTWQLCIDANFQGYCQEFGPGQHQNLGSLSGRVSSARLVAGGGGDGSGAGGGGWGSGRTRVILYEQPNFGGRSFTINNDYVDNLAIAGFNDRASSIRVERGYWLFCTDATFQGDCRTLGPGDYATLPYGVNNRISSARRISEEYPYSAPPRWTQ